MKASYGLSVPNASWLTKLLLLDIVASDLLLVNYEETQSIQIQRRLETNRKAKQLTKLKLGYATQG